MWWLANPSEEGSGFQLPEHWVSGEFYGEGSWELTTIGSVLSDDPVQHFASLEERVEKGVIWGTDVEGHRLSLFDVWKSGGAWQSDSPLGGNEKWHVGWYTSGNAWVERDEVVDYATIRFDALDDWVSSRILATHDFAFGDGHLRLPQPASHTATIDEATVTLRFGSEVRPAPAGYRASRYSAFNIKDDDLRLDEVVEKWVSPLMTFLDLLTAMSVRVTGITVVLMDTPCQRHRVLELHPNLIQPKEERDASRGQLDMLATRAVLQERGLEFPDLVQRYFALNQDRKHNTALGLLSHSQSRILATSTDSELLTAFQAIELYHQVAIGGYDIPQNVHKERVNAVVKGAPEQWQAWAREVLQDKNSKSLKTRLREVMDRASTTAQSIEQAWPEFCNHVVKYRNNAAHGTSAIIRFLGLRYHAGAVGFRWILRHVYLLELGLSETKASVLIQTDTVFKQEMRLLGEWHDRMDE